MLYDEIFEKELTEYHDNISGPYDCNIPNETIFSVDDKYKCEIHFDADVVIKYMCVRIDIPNMNEFMDEYGHRILDGIIYITIGSASWNICMNLLLVNNIQKHDRGYNIVDSKLDIPICDIDSSLSNDTIIKFRIFSLNFIDYKNISIVISVDANSNYDEGKDISLFFRKIYRNIYNNFKLRYFHAVDTKVYTCHCYDMDDCKYIYIVVAHTENHIDNIQKVSLWIRGYRIDIDHIDLHKIYVNENVCIIMIDMNNVDTNNELSHVQIYVDIIPQKYINFGAVFITNE